MTPHAPPAAQPVFIARQPIYDRANRRIAYELLYRHSQHATSAGLVSADTMCSDTALHAVVSIGLDRLVGTSVAFVNLTRDHLLGELYRIFEPKAVVLELLETIDGDQEVIAACERAIEDGYTLALDDYDARDSLDPLLPLVKLIKVDVLGKTREEIEPVVSRLRARGLTVLAERVETVEMLRMCEALGCALFQGYVFSRPEVLDGRVLSVEQASMLNIAALLGDTSVTDDTIADAFRSNPALSLALLRIVNAAAYGGRGVESIPHAIRLIGRAALSRWLLVMLVTSMGKESPIATELVAETLVRARFCELLAMRLSPSQAASHFLMGLLSRLDMLLGEPMDTVLQRLPVSPEVRDALLHRRGRHALHLSLAEHYESGNWTEVDAALDAISGTRAELGMLYAEAVAWAVERTTG